MAIGVMNWVWTKSRSHSGTRLVLLAIADCASGDGTNAWPSIAELKRKTGMCERTVQGCIASLVAIGELAVEYNAGPRGCNRYQILMNTPAESAPPPAESAPPQNDAGQKPHPRRICTPAESAPPQNRQGPPAESAPGTVLEPKDLQKPPTEVSARVILGDFIDWVRQNEGELTKRTIGQLAKQIGDLLAQGIPERFIRHGLAAWHARDQHPSTLDSFVNSALNATARSNSPNMKRSTTNDRVRAGLELAESYAADEKGELT